jgi:hypothetical protein
MDEQGPAGGAVVMVSAKAAHGHTVAIAGLALERNRAAAFHPRHGLPDRRLKINDPKVIYLSIVATNLFQSGGLFPGFSSTLADSA